AASAVAAAVATNALFGDMLLQEDLLPAVLEAEASVAGQHADNVAPALLGGVVLITGLSIGEIHRLPLPIGVYLVLTTPNIEVKTADARAMLPKTVPLNVLVHQTGVVAEVVHALHAGNHHLLARAMQRDAVVEPARSALIPKLAEVRHIATQAGALATVISGSGPTLCSLCFTEQDAEAVSRAVTSFYASEGIDAIGRTVLPAAEGARVLETVP
ncbi:MAG: homoserine kinase, partial [Anaerolineales bacterium]